MVEHVSSMGRVRVADSGEESAPAAVPPPDMSRVPRGERAARALVEAIAAGDDRLEGHALEIKGDLDLRSAKDKTKLAKFVLGAANRMPDKAASAFEGHAVMVIGVKDGRVVGVAPVENLDIENAITPYVGADGPTWDLMRVRVPGSPNDALLLLVDPPLWGQPPFPCLRDGVDLVDGEIYVRTNGKTSKAKSGDIKNLSRRTASAAAPAVAFEVCLDGEVVPVEVDDRITLDAYIASERSRLLDALPSSKPPTERKRTAMSSLDFAMGASAAQSAMTATLNVMTTPEPRTEDQYRTQIDTWEQQTRTAWPEGVDRLIGLRLPLVAPRVENLEEVFLHDVELVVHLEGKVRGVSAELDEYEPTCPSLGLPPTPRTWGPKPLDLRLQVPAYSLGFGGPAVPASPPSVSWSNTGSVTITFEVGDLRPRETYTCVDSDLILVVNGAQDVPIHGTWKITARDHHRIYVGELTVALAQPLDLTPELDAILRRRQQHE